MREPVASDLETTCLDATAGFILEYAMLLVDTDLELIGDFGSRVLHATEEQLATMTPFVTQMHTETGLLDEVRASTLTVEELEDEVVEWLAWYGHVEHENPADRTAAMLGASNRLDLNFVDVHMPRLSRVLHYTPLDVSGHREMLRMYLPDFEYSLPREMQLEDGWVAHRAASDIRWTLEEARSMRRALRESFPAASLPLSA